MDIKKESLASSIINFEPETISNPSGISNFHTKCGEVFVSKNNEFLVTCCQCNGSFGKFDIYLDHMKKLHLDNQIEKENSIDLSSNHIQFNNNKQKNTMDFYMERDQMEFISNNNQITHPPPPPSYPNHQQQQQQHHQSISSHTIVNNPINYITPSSEYKPIIDQSINNSLINKNNNINNRKLKLTNNTVQNHSYKCEYCYKEFTQSQNLTVHKRVHTGEKPYTCEFCNKSFSHKSNLNVHKRTHTGGYKTNNNKRNTKLENHQQQNQPHHHHQHQLTGYNSSTSNSSNSTTQNATNNYIEVPVNPYFMATTQILPIHSSNKIPENFQQNQFIGSSQNNNNNNTNDNTIHSDGLYKCEYCHKTFSQSQNLVVHKRIHTGEKPYTCEFCDKSFSHKSNLNVHKRTHTGLKPYKCDMCEKLFSDKSALIVHKRLHSGEKPFQCRFCDRSFAMKNDLKQHENTHTGEKPHQCETCDKSFANNSNLIIHRRIHTGEKPYECDVCYKAFRHNSNLIVHKRTHSNNTNNLKNDECDDKLKSTNLINNNNKQISNNDKNYHCNLCEKTYMNNSSLYTHKRTHHRDNMSNNNNESMMVAIGNEGLKLI